MEIRSGGHFGRLTVLDGTVSSSTNIDVGAAANTTGTLIVGADGLISGAPTINVGKLGTGILTVQSDGDISSTGSTTIGVGNGITGTATIIGNGTAGSATLLTGTLNVGSTGNGTVNVQLGGLLQNSGAAVLGTGSLFTGVGTGIVNVMNAGSTWNSLGLLEIGDGGSGEVNITLGGKVTGADTVIGASVNGGGEVNVNGVGSLWDNTGTVTVGGLGAGALNITNQGVVENADGVIGSAELTTSTGTVNVTGTGSQWNISDELLVGNGGTGSLNINAGGNVQSAVGRIGAPAGGAGNVIVDGAGSFWETTESLSVRSSDNATLAVVNRGHVRATEAIVGDAGSGTAHVTVDGDGSLFQAVNGLTIGRFGKGMFEITGGAHVQSSRDTANIVSRIGGEAEGTGHVLVAGDGSQWSDFTDRIRVGDRGDGTLEITAGGEVRSFYADIGTEDGGSGHALVSGVGSQWKNQHQPPGIGGNFFVGDAGDGTLEIAAGGTVIGTFSTIGNESTGTGLVTVDGVGSQWLNTDASETGVARLTVGRQGTGTLHITGGAAVTTDGVALIGQYFEEGTGTVTVSSTVAGSDSIWQVSGQLKLGVDIDAIADVRGGTGTLRIQPGGFVAVGEDTEVAAGDLLILEGGTFTTSEISFPFGGSADSSFQWTSGTLHAGVFQGDLVNSAGILAPGNSVGATEIQGNYNQLTSATLDIEIGPPGQGAQNDSVSVAGAATIDGQLNLSLIDGAAPLSSQTFVILDANTLIGSFDNITSGQRLTDQRRPRFVSWSTYGAGSAFDPNQVVLSNFLRRHSRRLQPKRHRRRRRLHALAKQPRKRHLASQRRHRRRRTGRLHPLEDQLRPKPWFRLSKPHCGLKRRRPRARFVFLSTLCHLPPHPLSNACHVTWFHSATPSHLF